MLDSDLDTSRQVDGVQLVQLGNYIYELGGWRGSIGFSPETRNTVHVAHVDSISSNNWRQLPNGPWEERHTFGAGVIGDTIYIWGTDNQADTSAHDSWKAWVSGANGALSWEQKTDTLPYPYRILAGYTVHNGYLYTVGGQSVLGGGGRKDDVWRSNDGENWTQINSDGPWEDVANYDGALVSWRGCLWLLSGGRYAPKQYETEVYRSCDDGTTWSEVTEAEVPSNFEAVQYHKAVVHEDRIWLTYGGVTSNDNGSNQIIVLDSTDNGYQWIEVYNNDQGRHAHGAISYETTGGEKKLFISTGTYDNGSRANDLLEYTNFGYTYKADYKFTGTKATKDGGSNPHVLWNSDGKLVDSEMTEDSIRVSISDNDLGSALWMQYDRVNSTSLPNSTYMENNSLGGSSVFVEDYNSEVFYNDTEFWSFPKTDSLDGLGDNFYAPFFDQNGKISSPNSNGIYRNSTASLGLFGATTDRQGGRSHIQIRESTSNSNVNIGLSGQMGSMGYIGGSFDTYIGSSVNANAGNLAAVRATGGDAAAAMTVGYWGTNWFTATGLALNASLKSGSSGTNLRMRLGRTGRLWIGESDPGSIDFNPSRTLHVEGEARITDLTTDTPTQIVGADADGDLGSITIGSGLSFAGGILSSSATAPAANEVIITDAQGYYDSTSVEGALIEVQNWGRNNMFFVSTTSTVKRRKRPQFYYHRRYTRTNRDNLHY